MTLEKAKKFNFSLFLLLVLLILAFNSEIRGKPTIFGCYLRGLHGIDDGVCSGGRTQ